MLSGILIDNIYLLCFLETQKSLTRKNEKNMIIEVITDHKFIIWAFLFIITIRETSQFKNNE